MNMKRVLTGALVGLTMAGAMGLPTLAASSHAGYSTGPGGHRLLVSVATHRMIVGHTYKIKVRVVPVKEVRAGIGVTNISCLTNNREGVCYLDIRSLTPGRDAYRIDAIYGRTFPLHTIYAKPLVVTWVKPKARKG